MSAVSSRSTVAAMAAGGLLTVGAGGLALWALVGAHAATGDHSAAVGYGSTRSSATSSGSASSGSSGGISSISAGATGHAPTAGPTTTPGTGPKAPGTNDRSATHDRPGADRLPPVGTWARGLLHGTVVVAKGSTTQTLVVQRGQVTARTATTVTVRSSDGYTLVWTLPATGRGVAGEYRPAGGAHSFPVGTTVEAVGTPSGKGTAVALAIRPWPHGKPIPRTLPPEPVDPTRPLPPITRPPITTLPAPTEHPAPPVLTGGPMPIERPIIDPPITVAPPITIAPR